MSQMETNKVKTFNYMLYVPTTSDNNGTYLINHYCNN